MWLGISLLFCTNIFSVVSENNRQLGGVHDLTCIQMSNNSAKLTWSYNEQVGGFKLDYRTENGKHIRVETSNRTFVVVDKLLPFYTYNISVAPYANNSGRLTEGNRSFVSCNRTYLGHLNITTDSVSTNNASVSIKIAPKLPPITNKVDFTMQVNCSSEESSENLLQKKNISSSSPLHHMTISKLLECSSYRCTASVLVNNSNEFTKNLTETFTLDTNCASPFTVKPMDGRLSVSVDTTVKKNVELKYFVGVCVRNSTCDSGSEPHCYYSKNSTVSHFYQDSWILQPQSNIDVCVSPIDITRNKMRRGKNCTCFVPTTQDSIKFQPLLVNVRNITSRTIELRGQLQNSFLNKSNNPVNIKINVQWKENGSDSKALVISTTLDKNGVFQKSIDGLQPEEKYDVKVTGHSRTGFEIKAYHESIVTKREERPELPLPGQKTVLQNVVTLQPTDQAEQVSENSIAVETGEDSSGVLKIVVALVASVVCGILLCALFTAGKHFWNRRKRLHSERHVNEYTSDLKLRAPNALSSAEAPLLEVKGRLPLKKEFPKDVHAKLIYNKEWFTKEFKRIQSYSPKYTNIEASRTENKHKNRYQDVLPYDHSRVKLELRNGEPGSDYINANYIKGHHHDREYIATQGPLQSTVCDFWRMVWETKAKMIVSMTALSKSKVETCEKFWPDVEKSTQHENLTVYVHNESPFTGYVMRTIKLCQNEQFRNVVQMQISKHINFRSDEDIDSFTNFITSVRHQRDPYAIEPIIVHCSGGIGRTGTFIALDYLMQNIKVMEQISVFQTVLEMRHYRCNMVQSKEQFIFLNKCLAYVIEKEEEERKALLDQRCLRTTLPGEPDYFNLLVPTSDRSSPDDDLESLVSMPTESIRL